MSRRRRRGTVFRRISTDVYQATRQKQLPELSLSLIGEFYLNGKLQINASPAPAPIDPGEAASEHWKSSEAGKTKAAYEDRALSDLFVRESRPSENCRIGGTRARPAALRWNLAWKACL